MPNLALGAVIANCNNLMDLAATTVSNPPKLDDHELIRRIVGGDQQALGLLYDRFSPILLGLANRILDRFEDAEEVVQEVFVHTWNHADRYDASRSSVSTWLILMVRSRAIDRLRNRNVVRKTLAAAQNEKPPTYASASGLLDVLTTERRRRVNEELALLPVEQSQVIELAFFKGMTQSEIAAETKIPLGTVKTRTLLAMKKLRKALRQEIRDLL